MANRIKGITVEINGDTTGLSKAIEILYPIVKILLHNRKRISTCIHLNQLPTLPLNRSKIRKKFIKMAKNR